jgi:hypothetical protein
LPRIIERLSLEAKRIHADVTGVATWLHRYAGGQILVGVSFDPAKCLHLSSVWVVQRGEGMEIDNGVAAAPSVPSATPWALRASNGPASLKASTDEAAPTSASAQLDGSLPQ